MSTKHSGDGGTGFSTALSRVDSGAAPCDGMIVGFLPQQATAKRTPRPARKPAKKPAKRPAAKMPQPRVPVLAEDALNAKQRALLDSIRSGPRGGSTTIRGPFAVFLHAPAFGELAQKLGGHC